MAKSRQGKRNALGKGLSALLHDNDEGAVKKGKDRSEVSNEEPQSAIGEINIDQIEVNPWQPRHHFDQEALLELAESIKVQGIIQPITVRKLSSDKYQLISGERRLQASKLADLETITAYIRKASDQEMLEMALIENIQRENLNAMEVAFSYQRLLDECKLRQEDLGERVGKKRATVTNYLRLLKLPPEVQEGLRSNSISMGHAKAILSLDTIEDQLTAYNEIRQKSLSVRKAEELVKTFGTLVPHPEKKEEIEDIAQQNDVRRIKDQLSNHFGTKIDIKIKQNKGEVKIPFLSIEDLNRILDIIDISNE